MEHFITRLLHHLLIAAMPLVLTCLIFHFSPMPLRASDRTGLWLLVAALVVMSATLALDPPGLISLRTKLLTPLALTPPLVFIANNTIRTIMAGLRWNAQLRAAEMKDQFPRVRPREIAYP